MYSHKVLKKLDELNNLVEHVVSELETLNNKKYRIYLNPTEDELRSLERQSRSASWNAGEVEIGTERSHNLRYAGTGDPVDPEDLFVCSSLLDHADIISAMEKMGKEDELTCTGFATARNGKLQDRTIEWAAIPAQDLLKGRKWKDVPKEEREEINNEIDARLRALQDLQRAKSKRGSTIDALSIATLEKPNLHGD